MDVFDMFWVAVGGGIVGAVFTRIGWGYELVGTWLDDITRRFRGQG